MLLQQKDDADITCACVDPTAPPHVIEACRKELKVLDAQCVERVHAAVAAVKEPNRHTLHSIAEWEDLAKQTKAMLADSKANSAFYQESVIIFKETVAMQKQVLACQLARPVFVLN